MEAYQVSFYDAVSEEPVKDIDTLTALCDELNKLIDNNIEKKKDEEGKELPVRNFYYDTGTLLMMDLRWGLIRVPEEDIATLSTRHKELIVDFTKRGDAGDTLNNGLTDLSHFWRAKLHDGQIISQFKAAPLEWVDATEMNWYL